MLIQSRRPSDIPLHLSQFQSNYGSRSVVAPVYLCPSSCSPPPRPPTDNSASSSSHLVSTGPTSDDWGPPTPSSSAIHPPLISKEQVSFPRVQSAGMPVTPFYPPGPPLPQLRPASWGSPSLMDEAFEGHRPTRSRSTVDFRGDRSEDEDLPFGGRTLPPLLALNDPWRSGVRPMTNISSSPDYSPVSEGLSITNSPPSPSFPTNYPNGGYR